MRFAVAVTAIFALAFAFSPTSVHASGYGCGAQTCYSTTYSSCYYSCGGYSSGYGYGSYNPNQYGCGSCSTGGYGNAGGYNQGYTYNPGYNQGYNPGYSAYTPPSGYNIYSGYLYGSLTTASMYYGPYSHYGPYNPYGYYGWHY